MVKALLTGKYKRFFIIAFISLLFFNGVSQKKSVSAPSTSSEVFNKKLFSGLKWRCIGPTGGIDCANWMSALIQ